MYYVPSLTCECNSEVIVAPVCACVEVCVGGGGGGGGWVGLGG
jgi:hypothetical protein